MRFKNLIFAFSFVAIITAGCDNTTEPTSNGVLMPLIIGNSWDYTITASDSNSTGVDTNILNHTIAITSDATINNEKWYALNGFFTPEDSTYFQNKSNGLWAFDADTAALVFKFPAEANTSYSLPDDDNVMKVISTSAVVNVPKGQFTCYHYRQERITSTRSTILDFYLVPNVGIVKMYQFTRRTNAGDISTEEVLFELIDYKLK